MDKNDKSEGRNGSGSYTPTTLALPPGGGFVPVPGTGAPSVETAATVLAAQAEALVKARFAIAQHRPRSIESVRQRLLALCADYRFAEQAWYCKPVGKSRGDDEDDGGGQGGSGVEGLSIRFVEAALQILRNVDTSSTVIQDDTEKRIVRITVADMEENVSYSTDVPVRKTVERKRLRPGEEDLVIRRRATSKPGQFVFIRWATDEEILDKVAALTSKAIREAGKRLIPADIRAEAERVILATLEKQDKAISPAAARRKILDNFFSVGIDADMVAEYLGHDRTEWTPKEIQLLRGTFVALREGLATWEEVVDGAPEVQKRIEEVAARHAQAQQGQQPQPQQPQGQQPTGAGSPAPEKPADAPTPAEVAAAAETLRRAGAAAGTQAASPSAPPPASATPPAPIATSATPPASAGPPAAPTEEKAQGGRGAAAMKAALKANPQGELPGSGDRKAPGNTSGRVVRGPDFS